MRKQTLLILTILLFLACNKELSDNHLNSSSVDNYMSLPFCVTYTYTTYATECWTDGGNNNSTTCKSVAVSNTYTVCYDGGGGGNITSNTWGPGGGDPDINPYSKPNPPAPPLKPLTQDHAYLCGAYSWKVSGGYFIAQFKELSPQLLNINNFPVYISYGQSSIKIPQNQVFNNPGDASKIWNQVWNNALDLLMADVRSGTIRPDDVSLKLHMTTLINMEIGKKIPGSTFSSPSVYNSADVPLSTLKWCSQRPDVY